MATGEEGRETIYERKARVVFFEKSIEKLTNELERDRESLCLAIGNYNEERINIFMAELQGRGLTWCTHCSSVLAESKTTLILVEGREVCGQEGHGCSYRDFSVLHRVCQGCCKSAEEIHGKPDCCWSIPGKEQIKPFFSFLVYRVERRNNACYIPKNGEWVKLEEWKYGLSLNPPIEAVEKLAAEFNLPPKLKLEDDKVVIV